MFGRF
jgi:hypothetical protein